MMPGGHLATALALSGAAYAATGSPEAAAGCFAGGFLIDVDHYLDYLVFEKQWRRPGPLHITFDILINGEYALKRAFLFYFFAYRVSKRFAAADLMDRIIVPDIVGKRPVREFFRWRPLTRKERPIAQMTGTPAAPSASSAAQERSPL